MPDGLGSAKTENSVYNKEEEDVPVGKKVSSFNFNNIFDSKHLGKLSAMDGKAAEKQNGLTTSAVASTTGNSSPHKRRRSSSGDSNSSSDLVVLSVVLNKKQKENDEVSSCIERLRQNGVNCVYFTMNDLRNGSKKPPTEIADAFRLSTSSASKQRDSDSKQLQLTQKLPNLPSIKSEDSSENSNGSTDSTDSLAIHQSVEKVINSFSASPSPSPPPPLSPQQQLSSSLLSPLLSNSKPPLLHNEGTSKQTSTTVTTTTTNKPVLPHSQPSNNNNCSSSQIIDSNTDNSNTVSNNSNTKSKKKRRSKPWLTHRKTHLKKKLKEKSKQARLNGIDTTCNHNNNNNNEVNTMLPSSTTPIITIPIITTEEISQDIVVNKNSTTKKRRVKRSSRKRVRDKVNEPSPSQLEEPTTLIIKNRINCNATVKSRAEPSLAFSSLNNNNTNTVLNLQVNVEDTDATGETDVTTTTAPISTTINRVNNLSPDVSYAISEAVVSKKKKKRKVNVLSTKSAATLSSTTTTTSSSSSNLLAIPDSMSASSYYKGNGEANGVSSSTSSNVLWDKKTNNSKFIINGAEAEVTTIQFKKTRAFSPDITFEKRRLPSCNNNKPQINDSKNNNNTVDSSKPCDSVLNVNSVVSGRKTNKAKRKLPINNNTNNDNINVKTEAPKCVQGELISKEIKVQVHEDEDKNQKRTKNVQKVEEEEEGVQDKDVEKKQVETKLLNGIVKGELNVKPKKKKRVKRNRLSFRKGSKGKKKKSKVVSTILEMQEDKDSNFANGNDDITEYTTVTGISECTMPSIITSSVPTGGQSLENEKYAQSSSSSKKVKLNKSVTIQEQAKIVDEEYVLTSLSVSTVNGFCTLSKSSSSNVTKNESGVITKDQLINQNCSLVIKHENSSNSLGKSEDSKINLESSTTATSTSVIGNGETNSKTGLVPIPGSEDSLPDAPDAMQLRRSSFYSLVSGNVRTNLENYLDGRVQTKSPNRRRKHRAKNGFLLHHGDNFPEDPEAPYKLHLATQVLLKLNKRRAKFKPKEDKGRSLLSYLKLVPNKKSPRSNKPNPPAISPTEEPKEEQLPEPVFSGEWSIPRKYVCGVCGQIEKEFWDMVMHKGEAHPGVVCTHTELAADPPPSLVRYYPVEEIKAPSTSSSPPPCTKCSATFSTIPDLHRHIFECAGNAAWLETEKVSGKKKSKRKRGFKRRLSNTPKKANAKKTDSAAKRRLANTEVFKCEFCSKSYKNQGYFKAHIATHSLPVSIPLSKLSLPSRASFNSLSSQLFQ